MATKDFAKYVGGKLLTLRGEKSQAEVSKAIDISRQALGTYENGERTMDMFTLKKISEYYNVSTDYLLGLSEVPQIDPKSESIYKELCDMREQHEQLIADIQNLIGKSV